VVSFFLTLWAYDKGAFDVFLNCPENMNVGKPITFAADNACSAKLLASGWAPVEKKGVWSIDKNAVLRIPTTRWPSGNVKASFDMIAYTSGFIPGTQVVTVSANGQELAQWSFTIGKAPPSTSLVIPRKRSNPLDITFMINPTINPKARGVSDDPRDLGINLSAVTFTAAD
jgi:hypothetical protein